MRRIQFRECRDLVRETAPIHRFDVEFDGHPKVTVDLDTCTLHQGPTRLGTIHYVWFNDDDAKINAIATVDGWPMSIQLDATLMTTKIGLDSLRCATAKASPLRDSVSLRADAHCPF
ncbi:hypothetical protein ml_225 [Mollivirus sibericum]|uniref:hypothetical protein n=1 Tax=Mollivirus sibericum TaxID=1678078 RepID=UPI0006B2EA80|nr:hypothetical protein ml_225 [Mollivirus sibericum]ALD62027.1 hypothetical protein ml_225 [Mollivirus sibericum]